MCRIRNVLRGLLVAISVMTASTAIAEDAWVQIEALPSLSEGEARARAYAGVFPNVNGFALSSGWYAVVLGPYPPDEALRQLMLLRGERMIPDDSYVADAARFEERFWPVGGAQVTPPAPATTETTTETTPDTTTETVVAPPPPTTPEFIDETPKQARLSEAALPPEDLQALQRAMQWQGFYVGKIDGHFGAGTRRSMAAWQTANGYDETGILTTRQRSELTAAYNADVAAIGLTSVNDVQAGIEITLPAQLVTFARYQPPFAQYDAKDGSGYQVLLISQEGDEKALYGLYDVMQTLDVVPLEGERERGRTSFLLTGQNAKIQSYTQVALEDGIIKGFTLVWPAADSDRAQRVLEAMKASFKAVGDGALDDSLGQPLDPSAGDLTAGLTVRHPIVSRSGFFVGAAGEVLTTTDVIRQCGRVTIDGTHAADVMAKDDITGLVLLKPQSPLAPPMVASFRSDMPRRDAEVAVAGYSYEDTLDAPVMTFGTLADTKGLDGETGLARLSLKALPGDAGGPVLDATGAVLGMLLPRAADGAKVLPDDVSYARNAAAMTSLLAVNGVTPVPVAITGSLADEDIAKIGTEMTVLVSCWE